MHQALNAKEKELEQQNLTKEEMTSKIQLLGKQRKEVEQFLEAQKSAALAAQGEQMAKEHLKELHGAEERLALREKQMQQERNKLELKLNELKDSNDQEKGQLRDQLVKMQDQLRQNEADLRSHKQEVSQDIDDEMKRVADFKQKKKSTDNLAINRLTDLLSVAGNNTAMQKLAKETEHSRVQLLGQEDAKFLIESNKKEYNKENNNDGADSDDLMLQALADLGGGDESFAPDEVAANGQTTANENDLPKKIQSVTRLRDLMANKMGGLTRMKNIAASRKQLETTQQVQNDVGRGRLLKELTQLKQSREQLLMSIESVGMTTPQGQQKATEMLQVDSEILQKK
jgi:hypothetical protein